METPLISIALVEGDKDIVDYFNENKIRGCEVVEIHDEKDLKKLVNADLVFLLYDKLNKPLKEQIKSYNWHLLVGVSQHPEPIFTSFIRASPEEAPRLINQLIECINIPCLTGLDFADIHKLFSMSPIMEVWSCKGKNIKDILDQIKYKKLKACMFILSGSEKLQLDNVLKVGEHLNKISEFVIYGSRIDPSLKDNLELVIFGGFLTDRW